MKGPGGSGEGVPDGGGVAPPVADGALVSPERVWRERAEEAERRAKALGERVEALEAELESARRALTASERRHEIERCCAEADPIDAETVALLTEIAVAEMEEPDVRAAVEGLRRAKPFLFRRRGGAGGGAASSPAAPGRGGAVMLAELAEEARETGDRRALLRYLSQRRGA